MLNVDILYLVVNSKRKGEIMTEGIKRDGAWIGVDLDGTLAHYDQWRGATHIGEPIAPMVDTVKAWLEVGVDVRIVTARVAGAQSYPESGNVRWAIQRWCWKHCGKILPITASKDYGMVNLWDDRVTQVVKNTGVPLSQLTRDLAEDVVNYATAEKSVIEKAEYILKVLDEKMP